MSDWARKTLARTQAENPQPKDDLKAGGKKGSGPCSDIKIRRDGSARLCATGPDGTQEGRGIPHQQTGFGYEPTETK